MVYQVGSPAILDGNRFLPETGTPIWKIERSRMVLALCDPDPFAVATWMLKSLTMGLRSADVAEPCTAISVVAINTPSSVAPRNKDGGGVALIIGQLSAGGNYSGFERDVLERYKGRELRGWGHSRWVESPTLNRLVVLRHVAELLVARVQQLLQRQLFQFAKMLLQRFSQSSGSGSRSRDARPPAAPELPRRRSPSQGCLSP